MSIKNKLCNYIANNQNMDEDEREILEYGMEIFFKKVLFFLGAIIIAILMKSIKEGLVFMLLFSLLRQNAGGVHMKSQFKCAVSSALLYISALLLVKLSVMYTGFYLVIGWLTLLSIVAIIWLAPIDNPNKRLDIIQKKKLSVKVKLITLLMCAFIALTMYIDYIWIASTIAVVIILEGILLIVGKILSFSHSV